MKKFIFIILLFICAGLNYSIAQNEHPDLYKLMDAAGESLYLKDFEFQLKPGEETQFAILLDKRTLYELYAELDDYQQFRLTFYNNFGSVLYQSKDQDKGIIKFTHKCNRKATYLLNVKNTSDQEISSTILLSVNKKFGKHEVVVQDPSIQKLRMEIDYSHLKDFSVNIPPGGSDPRTVLLKKNMEYTISWFQNENLKFELYQDKKKEPIAPSKIDINENHFITAHYRISKTAPYHLFVENIGSVDVKAGILLSFFGVIENKNQKIQHKIEREISPILGPAITIGENDLFLIAEVMPKFRYKSNDYYITDFNDFIAERLQYPEEAKASSIKGTVHVQFTVSKEGYVKDAIIMQGVHPALDQEALRIVYSSPKWTPGKQKGELVNVIKVCKVEFK